MVKSVFLYWCYGWLNLSFSAMPYNLFRKLLLVITTGCSCLYQLRFVVDPCQHFRVCCSLNVMADALEFISNLNELLYFLLVHSRQHEQIFTVSLPPESRCRNHSWQGIVQHHCTFSSTPEPVPAKSFSGRLQ